MKNYLSLLLSAMLLLGIISGCSTGTETVTEPSESVTVSGSEAEAVESVEPKESTEPAAQPGAAESAELTDEPDAENEDDFIYPSWPLDETVSFTMFFQYNARDSIESGYEGPAEYPSFQKVEELTNVHINFDVKSMDVYQEQFNLQIASQDYDDLYLNCFSLYTSGGEGALQDEVWIDLSELMFKYCPNYCSLLNDDMLKASYTDEGHIMSFMQIQENSVNRGYAMRGDWLEEQGIEAPSTLDEWYDAALVMKNAYSDTLSYVIACLPPSNAFYADTDFLVSDDGTVSYKYYQNDDFVEWLRYGVKWYEAGLLTSEIVLGSYDGMGLSPNDIDGWASTGKTAIWNSESRFITADEDYEGVTYEAIPIPSIIEGEKHWAAGIDDPYLPIMNISTSCKNTDIAMQWIDWFYSEEGHMMANYGIEGLNYYYDENRDIQYTEEYIEAINNNASRQQPFAGTSFGRFTYAAADVPDYLQAITSKQKALDAVELWNSDQWLNENRFPAYTSLTPDESARYSALYNDVTTYVSEFICKVICGDEDLDAGYSEYLTTLKTLGVQEMLDLQIAAYERYLER